VVVPVVHKQPEMNHAIFDAEAFDLQRRRLQPNFPRAGGACAKHAESGQQYDQS
jgi:hypothetical protein